MILQFWAFVTYGVKSGYEVYGWGISSNGMKMARAIAKEVAADLYWVPGENRSAGRGLKRSFGFIFSSCDSSVKQPFGKWNRDERGFFATRRVFRQRTGQAAGEHRRETISAFPVRRASPSVELFPRSRAAVL